MEISLENLFVDIGALRVKREDRYDGCVCSLLIMLFSQKKGKFVTFFTIYYLETNIDDTLGVQSKICQNCVFHRIIDFWSW